MLQQLKGRPGAKPNNDFFLTLRFEKKENNDNNNNKKSIEIIERKMILANSIPIFQTFFFRFFYKDKACIISVSQIQQHWDQ